MMKSLIMGLAILLMINYTWAKEVPGTLHKPSTLEYIQFNGNNISSSLENLAYLSSHNSRGFSGSTWPGSNGGNVVFSSGIWVMGKKDGELGGAVNQFVSEWTPGPIPYDAIYGEPLDQVPQDTPLDQIYVIQKGNTADLTQENYHREYAQWPASYGAPAHDGEYYIDENMSGNWDGDEPFDDYNGNGLYDLPDGLMVTGEDPPDFRGESMAWYIVNDVDTVGEYKTIFNPIHLGLEMQVLIYAFTSDTILNNVQYQEITIVNKSGIEIDSAYFGIWQDFDIGDYYNDASGCDPELNLAFGYNYESYDYGFTNQSSRLVPPAVGTMVLQGPMVDSPGDTVRVNGSIYPNQNLLGMTAFYDSDDDRPGPYCIPQEPEAIYNVLQGLTCEGEVIQDPWGNATTFMHSGNPVTGNGWVDEWYEDQRTITGIGPFTLLPWLDTDGNGVPSIGEPGVQVVKLVMGIIDGVDHRQAVDNLKLITQYARYRHAIDFQKIELKKPQELLASSEEGRIILSWRKSADTFEKSTVGDYQFEGYNVYQGESEYGPWTKIKTFDIQNHTGNIYELAFDKNGILQYHLLQTGSDTGLERSFMAEKDYLLDGDLVNNKEYIFAISAYAYAEGAFPRSVESDKTVVSVRPHRTYDRPLWGDTLTIKHQGYAETEVSVRVVDPGQLTGDNYSLVLDGPSEYSNGVFNILRDSPENVDTALSVPIVYELRPGYANDTLWNQTLPIFEGLQIRVEDIYFKPPERVQSYRQIENIVETNIDSVQYLAISPGGVDHLVWVDSITKKDTINLDTLSCNDGCDRLWWSLEEVGPVTWFTVYREYRHDMHLVFASWFGGSGKDRLADIPGMGGGITDPELLQADLEIRFTESGQAASYYVESNGFIPNNFHVPFEIWDIAHNKQLCVGIVDWNENGGILDTSAAVDYTLDRDWVVVFHQDYEQYGDSLQSLHDNPKSSWCWQFYNSRYSIGDILQLQFIDPIIPGEDVYSWSTAESNTQYDENALEQINIFPNPYFGYHADQTDIQNPYVTLSNLPDSEVTIRIYSLAGQLVRRLDHDSGTYEVWDLLTEQGAKVASGMYIAHIEVEGIGNKILKIAVFQPE